MVKSFLIFYLILLGFPCFSATNDNSNSFLKIPENYLNRVVSAIWVIEGKDKTKYPFGVRSINTGGDYEKAKRICSNTVSNQFNRWQAWGRTNSFNESLASRYCPKISDPIGHRNWLNNINKMVK